MPINGSGVYVLPSGTLAVTGTVIDSADYNAFLNDLVTVLNTVRPVSQGGTGGSSVVTAQQSLDLEPGVDIQAYSAKLANFNSLTATADKLSYHTGANTFAITDLSAIGKTVIGAADAAAIRTALTVPSSTEAVLQTELGSGANDVLQLDGSGNIPSGVEFNGEATQSGIYDFHMVDEKTSGTSAGSSSLTWAARTINTIKYNPDSVVSIVSGNLSFTTTKRMRIDWETPGYACTRYRSRLVRTSDSAVMAYSGNSTAPASSAHMTFTKGTAVVDAGTYRIEQISSVLRSGDGLGLASSMGPEIYTQVYGWVEHKG